MVYDVSVAELQIYIILLCYFILHNSSPFSHLLGELPFTSGPWEESKEETTLTAFVGTLIVAADELTDFFGATTTLL